MNETGELSRSTSRTFTYNFTRYIKDKIASDTATVSSQAFSRGWGYDLSGFTNTETVYGVPTTFTPDSYGNVASATNARSYQTSFDYSWGVRSRIQTPQHLTTRTINADGTV